MGEYDFSAFGLTEPEAQHIDAALKEYASRFGIDEQDDAVQDGWLAILQFAGLDHERSRSSQIACLVTEGCNAACDFVRREAYDAPLGPNGSVQTHRMSDIPEE